MKQATLNLNLNLKKTRKREFLEQMEQVVPWGDLVALIAPDSPTMPSVSPWSTWKEMPSTALTRPIVRDINPFLTGK
jgi:hypothetical protein